MWLQIRQFLCHLNDASAQQYSSQRMSFGMSRAGIGIRETKQSFTNA